MADRSRSAKGSRRQPPKGSDEKSSGEAKEAPEPTPSAVETGGSANGGQPKASGAAQAASNPAQRAEGSSVTATADAGSASALARSKPSSSALVVAGERSMIPWSRRAKGNPVQIDAADLSASTVHPLSVEATETMASSLRVAADTDLVLPPVPGVSVTSPAGASGLHGSQRPGAGTMRFGHSADASALAAAQAGTATVVIGPNAIPIEVATGRRPAREGGAWVEHIGTGQFRPWRAGLGRKGATEMADRDDMEGAGSSVPGNLGDGIERAIALFSVLAGGLLAGASLLVLVLVSALSSDTEVLAAYGPLASRVRITMIVLASLVWVSLALPLLRQRWQVHHTVLAASAVFSHIPALLPVALASGGSSSCDDDIDAYAAADSGLSTRLLHSGGPTIVAQNALGQSTLALLAAQQATAQIQKRDSAHAKVREARMSDAGRGADTIVAVAESLHTGSDLSVSHRRAAAAMLTASMSDQGTVVPSVESVLARSDATLTITGGGGSSRDPEQASKGCCSRNKVGASSSSRLGGGVPGGWNCAVVRPLARQRGLGICSGSGGLCGCLSSRGLRWTALLSMSVTIISVWATARTEALLTAHAFGLESADVVLRLGDWRNWATVRFAGCFVSWIFISALVQRQRVALHGAQLTAWFEAARRAASDTAVLVASADPAALAALSKATSGAVASSQLAAAERVRTMLEASSTN
jgi:hypothetical protein